MASAKPIIAHKNLGNSRFFFLMLLSRLPISMVFSFVSVDEDSRQSLPNHCENITVLT
jgi:hypothetical protein